MTKTRHPAAGMTKAQRALFDAVTVNPSPLGYARRTFTALMVEGLIQRGPDKVIGQDTFGQPVRCRQYFVPLAAHRQWCAWCAENVKADDDAVDDVRE